MINADFTSNNLLLPKILNSLMILKCLTLLLWWEYQFKMFWIETRRRGRRKKSTIWNISRLVWTRPQRGWIPPPVDTLPFSPPLSNTQMCSKRVKPPLMFCFSAVISRLLQKQPRKTSHRTNTVSLSKINRQKYKSSVQSVMMWWPVFIRRI